MIRVQSKLLFLSLAALCSLSLFIGVVVHGSRAEYLALSGFRETSEISLAAYELANNVTVERQLAYQASAFLGEGTPEEMIARYAAQVAVSDRSLNRLQELATAGHLHLSDRFRAGLAAAIDSAADVTAIRAEIVDLTRSREKKDAQNLKTRALAAYDGVLFNQSKFLPTLALEANDAELSRRIITQDNIARLQKDFWKIKGLLNTVLRDQSLKEQAAGEIKMKLEAADYHRARVEAYGSPEVVAALTRLCAGENYRFIDESCRAVLAAGISNTDFSAFGEQAAYHHGPFTAVEQDFAQLSTVVNQGIQAYTEARISHSFRRYVLQAAVGGVVLLGVSLLTFWISRGISIPLRKLAGELEAAAARGLDAAGQIARSAHTLSNDAAEEAAALEEITGAAETLSKRTDSNVASIRGMSAVAERSDKSVRQGRERVSNLVGALDSIQETNAAIAGILKSIDEIAFQTNILALNAAVEAARAGEAGAGFAVVADEVRTLAQRSAQAARETAAKIETARRSSVSGAELGRQVESSFFDIAEATGEFAARVGELEQASVQSAVGINQIRDSIVRLDQITQRTAAAAEENAGAATEMSDQVGEIYDGVEVLDRLVSKADAPANGATERRSVARRTPPAAPTPQRSGRVAPPVQLARR